MINEKCGRFTFLSFSSGSVETLEKCVQVTLFIGIINCFFISDKWEVTGFARIPIAVDKFPIERFPGEMELSFCRMESLL